MLGLIWSLFGWRENPPHGPPLVTFTGVRIPADGSPPHLLTLATINDCKATDNFLFRVPDLRHWWKTETAWRRRDLFRIDLQQNNHIPPSHFLRQKNDLKKVLNPYQPLNGEQRLHLRQRYFLPQEYRVLLRQHFTCAGAYYVFYSFDFPSDEMPTNLYVPHWIRNAGDGSQFSGDVFLIKMSPLENEEHGWAVYDDVNPLFLDILVKGPQDMKDKVS